MTSPRFSPITITSSCGVIRSPPRSPASYPWYPCAIDVHAGDNGPDVLGDIRKAGRILSYDLKPGNDRSENGRVEDERPPLDEVEELHIKHVDRPAETSGSGLQAHLVLIRHFRTESCYGLFRPHGIARGRASHDGSHRDCSRRRDFESTAAGQADVAEVGGIRRAESARDVGGEIQLVGQIDHPCRGRSSARNPPIVTRARGPINPSDPVQAPARGEQKQIAGLGDDAGGVISPLDRLEIPGKAVRQFRRVRCPASRRRRRARRPHRGAGG